MMKFPWTDFSESSDRPTIYQEIQRTPETLGPISSSLFLRCNEMAAGQVFNEPEIRVLPSGKLPAAPCNPSPVTMLHFPIELCASYFSLKKIKSVLSSIPVSTCETPNWFTKRVFLKTELSREIFRARCRHTTELSTSSGDLKTLFGIFLLLRLVKRTSCKIEAAFSGFKTKI